MPHSHFVCSLVIVTSLVLIAISDGLGGQQQPTPEYVREKIVRFRVTINFEPDPELSYFDHLVGSMKMRQDLPRFVLLLGDKPDTPLEKCREVYVEKSVFLSVKIGSKYQPEISEKIELPQKQAVKP